MVAMRAKGARQARAILAGLVVTGSMGLVPPALANNALTPRTPPVFKHESCLRIVDRSVDPVFHLDFAIPYEDAMLTADELPDSRRFQFFALCSDQAFGERLPNWAYMEDAERAYDAGIIPELPEPGDVLELSPQYAEGHDDGPCALAMNGVDERIPITCEATEGALDWDTTDVPPGNYVIRGQTFEPEINMWEARRGVVQIVDAPDQRFPVVSLMFPSRDGTRAYESDGYRVVGCMDGPPETTVRLSWATASGLGPGAGEDAWTEFAVFDASDHDIDLRFEIPPEAVQQAVIFRGVAEGPDGRSWTSYAPHALIVYPGEGESEVPFKPAGPDFCGFYPDDEGDTTGGQDDDDDAAADDGTHTGSSSTTDSGGAESSSADDGGGGGCGCRTDRMQRDAWLLAFCFVALGAVRRRRSSPRP